MQTTEGVKLSALDPLPNGPQPNDLIETSTRRVTDPDRYESRHSPAASVMTPDATTEVIGKFRLATADEADNGIDGTVAVTPEHVMSALLAMLRYSVYPGSGISLDYNDGTGILTISAAGVCGTTNVLHIEESTGDYGYNEFVTDAIWFTTFGSITPNYVANGGGTTLHIGTLATHGTTIYFLMEAVLPRDWFSDLHIQGLNGGTPLVSADSGSYFISSISGHQYTWWSWTLADIGDFADLGDRNIGVCYNPIYQENTESREFGVNPGSAYAWQGFPVSDESLDTNAFTAMGGKMNLGSGYANPLYPVVEGYPNPAIFRGHCGIGASRLTSAIDGDWWIIILQNSTGSENYRITGDFLPAPGYVDTVDASYAQLSDTATPWGEHAYAWPVVTSGWGTGSTFTIESL